MMTVVTFTRANIIHRATVGNTRLLLLGCRAMTDCIDALAVPGDSFFDPVATELVVWQRQLGQAPLPLELPVDHPRHSVGTDTAAIHTWQLPDALTVGLETLRTRTQTPLHHILLVGFSTLLYRYTGQDELLITVPVYARDRLPGPPFSEPLGFRFLGIHLTGNLTPFELLSQVQRLLREQEYSDYLPCRWLAEATVLHSNLDRSALFQILFDANIAEPSDSGRGFQLDTPMEYLKNLPKVPELNWHIRSDGTRLVARLAYNARLFTAATIERFCGHLENLLRAVAANPDVPVGRLAMISPEERSQLIADARCSQRVYPTRPGIQLLFEDQVKQNPSSTALVFRDLRLSYQELNRRANRLAHCLQSRGVKRGTQVAILMERSADTVIAILAILKASGTYVPLDASYPRTRVSFILADAAIRVLITHRALVAALLDHKVELVVLEENQETTTTEDECNLACETEGSDTALVLYTSGSTGNPKGVLVRHDSLINLYHAYAEVYDYSAGAPSVCQTAFFSFAVFQADWIRALCSGGKLALCTPEVLLSPLRLYRFMREEEVDFAEFVPSLLRSLINYLQQSGKRLDCMHTIVVGSDRWYLREYHETQRYCGSNTHLIHVYGASETTFDSTWFDGTEVDPAGDQLAPIGKPFPNISVYVVDQNMQPVPIGVIGELLVGGAGIANGYVNLPELTREKFIVDPFSPESGRAFKTGDLARLLPDGNIAFFGRRDYQVKIHGFRIELGEIEAALEAHPAIQSCIIQPWEAVTGQPRLVAYCVYKPDAVRPSPAELRQFLSASLPHFVLPAFFMVLDALPLTPSGKVNRRVLPPHGQESLDNHIDTEASQTAIAQTITQILRKVLNAPRFHPQDNFFTWGGDSLAIIAVVAAIEETFGITLDAQDINPQTFETVDNLVQCLKSKLGSVPQLP